MTQTLRRREFLLGLAASGLAACAPVRSSEHDVPSTPPPSPMRPPTPTSARASERLRIAVIGAGGHGRTLTKRLVGDPRVAVTIVCDPDSQHSRRLAAFVEKESGHRPATVADLRVALDDQDVDAVVVAAPNHWHALAAVWALQAGKHLYLEKPATHALMEGPALRDHAVTSGLVVEVGTQRRSHPGLQEAIAALHSGVVGPVGLAVCMSFKRRRPIGPVVRGAWPPTLDPDLWFGPRSVERPVRRAFHYDWHWFTPYGNGGLGNNGVHRLDVARWGMDLQGVGDQVISIAGRLGPPDSGQTPNTALTAIGFGSRAVIHDLRGLPTRPPPGLKGGDEVEFHGSGARLVVTSKGGRLLDDRGAVVSTFGGSAADFDPIRAHLHGFVDAILDGDPRRVRVGVEEGVAGAAMCHSPAAAHAQAERDADALTGTDSPTRPGPSASDEAAPDASVAAMIQMCGPDSRARVHAFLAHAADQRGRLVATPSRRIVGEEVAGAPERFQWRPGFQLPAARVPALTGSR